MGTDLLNLPDHRHPALDGHPDLLDSVDLDVHDCRVRTSLFRRFWKEFFLRTMCDDLHSGPWNWMSQRIADGTEDTLPSTLLYPKHPRGPSLPPPPTFPSGQ